jgi:hypothetical protein
VYHKLSRASMLALQAREIFDEKLFLTEHHTHILATIHERDILVIQERKKKDSIGSAVDLTYFQHGLVPQKRLVRHEAIALMRSAHPPIPIHLNKRLDHYSGLIQKLYGAQESDVSDAEREHRRPKRNKSSQVSSQVVVLD